MTDTPAARRKREKLKELLAKAKDHVMSPAEIEAQRKSWVCGEMLLQYPTMTYDEAAALYDRAADTLPPVDQTAAPLGEFRDEAERKEFHAWIEAGKPKVWPPAKETAVGDDAVKDAVAILQTAVTGNCDRKNRHGYGDCGAEGIIARALAVLRGEATPE